MPIKQGKDKEGSFFKWGQSGKKYHFDKNDPQSRERARKKTEAQQKAIYGSGYKE